MTKHELAEVTCPVCSGDGYTSEHDSRNYETGEHDCSGCPIQVQCEHCMATGKITNELKSKNKK